MFNKKLLVFGSLILLCSCNSVSSIVSSGKDDSFEQNVSFESQTSVFSSETLSESDTNSSELSSEEIVTTEEIETTESAKETINYYNGYYSSLKSWTNGEDLKQQLHQIISSGTYRALTYTNPNYETNINADHSEYDFEKLDVIYSGDDCFYTKTNVGWQREHCFPASLMTGTTTGNASKTPGRATDFHNLWAADAAANSARSNRNYGIPNKNSENYVNRKTNNNKEGYSCDETYFEPGDNDKGLVSRSIFYMATMYCEDEYDSNNNVNMKALKIVEDPVKYTAGSDCEFSIGGLSVLLEWNKVPVSDLEAQHNESVYSHVLSYTSFAQGNRNPYVDYPELVDYVYGDKQNESGSLDNLVPSVVSLSREKEGHHNYSILTAKREYKCGETFNIGDYKLCSVFNDYSYKTIENSTCNYVDHKFDEFDGEYAEVVVQVEDEYLKYEITIDPAGECNHKVAVSKSNISKDKPNEDQEINLSSTKWIININAPTGFNLTNDNQRGGVKFGSATKPVEKLTLTSVDSYKIDAIFIEAFAGNKTSTYKLKITVGDTVINENYDVGYNNAEYATYGEQLQFGAEGRITFEFEGSNSLELNYISFNVIG